jgi:hypothetical protein
VFESTNLHEESGGAARFADPFDWPLSHSATITKSPAAGVIGVTSTTNGDAELALLSHCLTVSGFGVGVAVGAGVGLGVSVGAEAAVDVGTVPEPLPLHAASMQSKPTA